MTTTSIDYELEVIQENLQGPPGPRGIDALTVLSGNGPPTGSIGKIGDWYINKDTHYIFGPKDVSGWPTGISLIGPMGATGMVGPQGNQIFSGVGAPLDTIGIPGDFYIRAETGFYWLYGPKKSDNTWDPLGYVSLIGPASGRTINYGNGAPAAGLGADGDFYIRTDTWQIYGPKASGAWPSGVSIIGPTGPQGPTGAQGPAGSLTPTALGTGADFNTQTTTGWFYTPGTDTTATHAPLDAHQWYLEVFRSVDASNIAQLARMRDGTSNATYYRMMVAGTWTAWHQLLFADGGQTMTGGFILSPFNLGNITSPFTPNALNGNYQYGTNNGPITFNAPANDCAIDILLTNSGSAGAITFSGYTVAAGNTGDNLTTTNGQMFILSIRRIHAISTYMVKALQ